MFSEVPQGLFVAVIRYWFDSGVFLPANKTSIDMLQKLANYPVGRPAASWEDIKLGSVSHAWVEQAKAVYKDPQAVPFLPCGMSAPQWFFSHAESALGEEFYAYGEDYHDTLKAWSDKIGLLRVRALGGRFPWRAVSRGCNWYCPDIPTEPDWDTHLHLEALFDAEDFKGKWNYGSDDYGDDRQNDFKGFGMYRHFWLAAERDGFPELGNAAFAFYLLRKSIFDARDHPHLEVEWPVFSEHLRLALARPGHRWIARAIEFMKSSCKSKEWKLDLLRLRNILPDSAEIIAFPALGTLNRKRGNIKRNIEQDLGAELCGRMSPRTMSRLIDAELRYESHAPNLGRGGISNVGPEVVAYALVYENELNERLSGVYQSASMVDFLTKRFPGRPLDKIPTIGTYLHVLGLAYALPHDVVEEINRAGVRLHEKPELLKKLGVLKDRRNPAAHGARNAPELLVRERAATFDEGLLREFLEALVPPLRVE